ncbi:MAG: hypothetical protein ACYC4L_04795 [Chloroflexota bacterium]
MAEALLLASCPAVAVALALSLVDHPQAGQACVVALGLVLMAGGVVVMEVW